MFRMVMFTQNYKCVFCVWECDFTKILIFALKRHNDVFSLHLLIKYKNLTDLHLSIKLRHPLYFQCINNDKTEHVNISKSIDLAS